MMQSDVYAMPVGNTALSTVCLPAFAELNQYRIMLKQKGMVDISKCFSNVIQQLLTNETLDLYEEKSMRRDFHSQHTDTPRHMFTVGERAITESSQLIKNFYYSHQVLQLISDIAQEKIDHLPWTGERFVINALIQNNDTHGWHWDDYAYALVFIAKCPPRGFGGEVECVAHTHWNKENPNIRDILQLNPIQSHYFMPGSFYLMRSDTTLHRVTSIQSPHQRLSIAMSYCNQADLDKNIDHKTVIDLYN